VGDPACIGAALIDTLPGGSARPAALDSWNRPEPVRPGFVVDLLTAASRIDAGATDTELASRALAHMLAWPRTYGMDNVLVPAALIFAERAEGRAWPAIQRLREACLDHLQRRIALPLEAPQDWTRANPLKCRCADCRSLGDFLVDPNQEQWRLKAVQGRRMHVEESVRRARCDLDLTTEKRGSPHTLVATKNQASYERRVAQRRNDLEHVAALSG
jgi:hypothetical protein